MRTHGLGWPRTFTFWIVLSVSFTSWRSLETKGAGQPWDGSAFSANPKAILAAAQSLVKDGSDATVVLLDERRIVLDVMSRAVETHRVVYKIGKEDAEDWSNIEAAWKPWRQERPTLRARVITKDAKQIELDRRDIAEAPLAELGNDTFGDTRLLRAPLPAIGADAVVETQTIVRDTSPYFDQGISRYIPIGKPVPTLQTLVVIEAPASLPLKHAAHLVPDLKPTRSVSGNKVTMSFEFGRVEAVDPVEIFLQSPGDFKVPYLAFSTAASWSDVAAGFARIVESQIAQGDIASMAKEVVGSATGREEIVDRLLQHVQKKIRYKAVELGDSAIIPTPPMETLRLEYGDCKDQAALLISMLRTLGIDAHMALLSATGFNPDPNLPGFGGFDHAIVYVPGDTPLWIDSTAGFSRVGQLPMQDQGRLALIVKPDSTTLVRIPEFKSRMVETREIFLSEMGAGRVIETTEYFGTAELDQRSTMSELRDADLRKHLEQYAEAAYAAKAVDGIQHTDPLDMTAPFRLRFEAKDAHVASTDLREAATAIGLGPLVGEVEFLLEEPEEPGKESKGERLHLAGDSSKEWRYRIVPPAGFRKNKIPENKAERWGPATLAWEFSSGDDGTVTGSLRFDTGKRVYTAEDAAEVRRGLKKLQDSSLLLISFESVGEVDLSAGRVREALAEFRRLARLHPGEALHHSQVARALLSGGLGEAARAEARRAVEVEPASVVANQVLGITMEHDLAGRRFKEGWDREAAAAAYRKAIELDPENLLNHSNLAVLLEHNQAGQRYAPGANLDDSIAQYRIGLSKAERAEDKTVFQENLSIALLWAGQMREVRDLAVRVEIRLAAIAALDGVDAAVREAGRLYQAAAQRQAALAQVGSVLLQMRMYTQAAETLRAAAIGAPNASEMLSRAEQTGRIKRYEDLNFSDKDPRNVVKQFMGSVLTGKGEDELVSLVVKEHRDSLRNASGVRVVAQNLVAFSGGAPVATVTRDMLVSLIEMTAEGDDNIGFRVNFRPPGANSGGRLYVKLEEGTYKLLTLDQAAIALALEALRHVDRGDNAGAKRLLDWARDEIRITASDINQITGDAFFRQWSARTDSQQRDAQVIRQAVAALLSGSSQHASAAIAILDNSRKLTKDTFERTSLDLPYAAALLTLGRYEESVKLGQQMLARTQDASTRLVVFNSLLRLGKFDEAKKILQNRTAPRPTSPVSTEIRAILESGVDLDTNRRLAAVESRQGNFRAAESLLRQNIATPNISQGADYNNLAWLSLFRGNVTDEDVSTALRAVSLEQNRDAASLHTLAALYAERGQTAESLQVIYQAMSVGRNTGIGTNDWYVLGRIYEQLGEPEAAVNAFKRVELPKGALPDPSSTYALAQRRLQSLTKN